MIGNLDLAKVRVIQREFDDRVGNFLVGTISMNGVLVHPAFERLHSAFLDGMCRTSARFALYPVRSWRR